MKKSNGEEWALFKRTGKFPGDPWEFFSSEKKARKALAQTYESDLKTFRLVKITYEEVFLPCLDRKK